MIGYEWNQSESIGFPGNVGSVVSAIVAESDCAVVEEPVFHGSEGWLTGNVWVPVLVEVDFQCVDDALGRVSLIIHLTSIDGLSNCAVSENGAVGVSIQFRVVKLRWPGSVGSVVCSVVVQVDGAIVVNPKSHTSKAVCSFGKNIPFFIDLGQQVVVDAFSGVELWGNLTGIDGIVNSIGLIICASLQQLLILRTLNLILDLEHLFLQDKAQRQGNQ